MIVRCLAGRIMLALFAVLTCATCAGSAARTTPNGIPAAEWERLLAAEDARISTAADSAAVQRALASGSEALRAMAVRAMGRTERYEFMPTIARFLNDQPDSVRIAAAHALALVARETLSTGARRALIAALPQPGTNAGFAAAAAEALGRLSSDDAGARDVARRLAAFLPHDGPARTGALRGLYFLARQTAGRTAIAESAAQPLHDILTSTTAPERDRALAMATLALARVADEQTIRAALHDPAPHVRREAVAAAQSLGDTAALRRIATAAIDDPHPAVRSEAVRSISRATPDAACAAAAIAARDTSVQVALLAIDLLGNALCRSTPHVTLLDSLARSGSGADWHRAAHAAASLAAIHPGIAPDPMRELANHASPFARAYAARAAGAAADTAVLHRLVRDSVAIVRTAATAALHGVAGSAAYATYIDQLANDDSELLMTAAAALEGATDPAAPLRLLAALERVSALRRETSRDARLALLERVQELGGRQHAARVRPYLTDFDPVIAERAATILESWTGTRPQTAPQPLPRLPLPSFEEASTLARSEFVLEMQDGGEIVMALLPFDAPTNAARFARLARSGWFDGLTFHRVVPDFVVQGGSPGANEYSGDGPFTRDELGVPNWRGTVGLSTRGRDTGDGQIYVNLIDNVRLDTDYTVFGVVTRGMDVVDRLLEGAVIRRVREVRR